MVPRQPPDAHENRFGVHDPIDAISGVCRVRLAERLVGVDDASVISDHLAVGDGAPSVAGDHDTARIEAERLSLANTRS